MSSRQRQGRRRIRRRGGAADSAGAPRRVRRRGRLRRALHGRRRRLQRGPAQRGAGGGRSRNRPARQPPRRPEVAARGRRGRSRLSTRANFATRRGPPERSSMSACVAALSLSTVTLSREATAIFAASTERACEPIAANQGHGHHREPGQQRRNERRRDPRPDQRRARDVAVRNAFSSDPSYTSAARWHRLRSRGRLASPRSRGRKG